MHCYLTLFKCGHWCNIPSTKLWRVSSSDSTPDIILLWNCRACYCLQNFRARQTVQLKNGNIVCKPFSLSICWSAVRPSVRRTVRTFVRQLVGQSVGRSVRPSNCQSVSQSFSQWVRPSFRHLVNQSVSPSICQSDIQSMSPSVRHLVSRPVRPSVHLLVSQSFSQWVRPSVCHSQSQISHSVRQSTVSQSVRPLQWKSEELFPLLSSSKERLCHRRSELKLFLVSVSYCSYVDVRF